MRIGTSFALWTGAVYAGGVAGAAVALPDLPGATLAALAALAALLVWLSVTDARHRRLPDAGTAGVFGLGLLALHAGADTDLWRTLVLSAVVLALFWLAGELHYRLRGAEGLGIGDAKLMAAAVPWVGATGFWIMLALAAGGGIAFVLLSRQGRRAQVPFGIFLSGALFVVTVVRLGLR